MFKQIKYLLNFPFDRWIVLIFFIFIFTSCLPKYMLIDARSVKQNESIVYGTVKLPKGEHWISYSHELLLMPPQSNKAKEYLLTKTGPKSNYFYWSLQSGKYEVLKLITTGRGSIREIPIRASFTIPENSKSIYIGDLVWDEQSLSFNLQDNYQEATARFKEKFPDVTSQSLKRLLQEEKIGNYKGIKHICHQDWGVHCIKPFLGLEAIYPPMSKVRIMKVDSMSPTLKWSASKNRNVSYDLVIFEEIELGFGGNHTSGRVILYRENLSETRYKLTQPLQPKSKYYWSARLRQGNTVSTWSTFNYFWTVILMTRGGSNLWFEFETP